MVDGWLHAAAAGSRGSWEAQSLGGAEADLLACFIAAYTRWGATATLFLQAVGPAPDCVGFSTWRAPRCTSWFGAAYLPASNSRTPRSAK